MIVLICGGRDLNENQVCKWLQAKFLYLFPYARKIIHGNAKGGDKGDAWFCQLTGFPVTSYPADWKTHGKAAGPIRNQQMLDEGDPDIILAFPGGVGTDDMIRRGKLRNLQIFKISQEQLDSV